MTQSVGHNVAIEVASASDLAPIQSLLEQVGLPSAEVQLHIRLFLVARADEQVIGCIGMEQYGESCLLRSLAVHPDYRGRGLGRMLIERIIARARERGAREAVILTNTVAPLAAKFGFQTVPRESVASPVADSWEFRANCCRSAVCMRLRLL
ncbi:MAG: GNAT family N-acetyltransferase [Acidobacteriota bacterium]|nr:GNAT family N-acetyltransferase [Blastocatellia bacterium]MDW8238963.1 GNAT family N-acetyltransferase [Acidobacteriota bacterium]